MKYWADVTGTYSSTIITGLWLEQYGLKDHISQWTAYCVRTVRVAGYLRRQMLA